MIQSFQITNHVGETLLLPLSNFSNSGIIVVSVDGLGPSEASINTTDYAVMDGSYFNSAHVNTRNINLKLRPMEHMSVEESRHRIYKYFPVKQKIKMEVFTDRRVSSTEGYVESVTPDIFSDQEDVDISIICPDPFFYARDDFEVVFSGEEPAFEFPFSNEGLEPQLILGNVVDTTSRYIYYDGDSAVGMELHLFFSGAATGIGIFNTVSNKAMHIDETKIQGGFQDQDELIISTVRGKKQVRLLRNGLFTNVLNAVTIDSDWLDIQIGANTIVYSATTGQSNIELSLTYKTAYEGI